MRRGSWEERTELVDVVLAAPQVVQDGVRVELLLSDAAIRLRHQD